MDKLNPWSRVLLEELRVTQLAEKFPVFHGTLNIITLFTRPNHCFLSWATVPYIHILNICFNAILLSIPICPNWSFPFMFPAKLWVCISHFPHARYISRPSISKLIVLTVFGEECKLWSFSLSDFLQLPFACSDLGPNILLVILYSDTFKLCSSLKVRDVVSRQYETLGERAVYAF
jgi:hypothetical protein